MQLLRSSNNFRIKAFLIIDNEIFGCQLYYIRDINYLFNLIIFEIWYPFENNPGLAVKLIKLSLPIYNRLCFGNEYLRSQILFDVCSSNSASGRQYIPRVNITVVSMKSQSFMRGCTTDRWNNFFCVCTGYEIIRFIKVVPVFVLRPGRLYN